MRRRVLRLVAVFLVLTGQLAIALPAHEAQAAPTRAAAEMRAVAADPGDDDEAPESADDPSDPDDPGDPDGPSGPTGPVGPSDPSSPPASATASASPTATTPAPTSSTPRPSASAPKVPLTVTIDFDDGTADQYQTAALLRARGLAGVYYVNSGRVGLTDGYLSADQVRQLQADGNEIGGHTVFHLHLPQQSLAEQQRQICTDRNQLLGLGLRITDLAFPFGEFTASTQNAARQCGYNSVRTSEGDSSGQDTVPPVNPYQLKALSSLGSTTTTEYVIAALTKAQQTSGGLMQVVFHRICTLDPCRANAIRLSVFTQVLDWLAAQRQASLIQVKTVAQVIGGAQHTPVAPPAPTAALAVPNPSFEAGVSVADAPTCWEHTVSGDGNVATWSLTRGGHSGTWAEHLDASKIIGGVGLVVTQDEGTCAAPTVVGDRYTYSVWYKSDAPVQLVSYRRMTSGGYLSFGLSAPFPASPEQWSYATLLTRAMPTGTTGLSVGIAIKTAGHFSFDDFTLESSGPVPPPSPASVATDYSTPSAVPVAIPIVAVAHVTAAPRHDGWTGWIALGALLLLAALTLALIDRRLAGMHRR